MKLIILGIFSLFFLFSSGALSATVDIKIDPPVPVAREPFQLVFEVVVDKESQRGPIINFTLDRGEIRSQNFMGTTTNATFINGQAKVSKTYRYQYEIFIDRPGITYARNIKVDVGGSTIAARPKMIKVVRERPRSQDFFLDAQVSKDTVYLGEGIDLRYYLYNKVSVKAQEIELFPKLHGFIKRFHMPDQKEETVELNGEVYRRSLQYSARIYPEKTGQLKVDPLRLKVQYSSGRMHPFGHFNLSFGRMRTRSLVSKARNITVHPVPQENLPKSFTGLVGEHKFRFLLSRTKFLVNGPIEMELEVEGEGALEKLEVPQLLSHPSIEVFDIKNDLREKDSSRAIKKFEFTYLPRKALEIPSRKISFFTFDPRSHQFVENTVTIPLIEIKGGPPPPVNTQDQPIPQERPLQAPSMAVLSPLFIKGEESFSWARAINLILGGAIVWILFLFLREEAIRRGDPPEVSQAIKALKKQVDFRALSNFFRLIRPQEIPHNDSLVELIGKLQISPKARRYFLQCVNDAEKGTYAKGQKKKKISFQERHFREALRALK